MQLSMMLIVVVSILTVLSGILVLAGSNRKDRSMAIWFLLIAVGATMWAVSIGVFLGLPAGEEDAALGAVLMIFAGSLLTMTAVVGHTGWKYRVGRVVTGLFVLISVGLVIGVFCVPSLLFSGVELSNSGNVVSFAMGPISVLYGGTIVACSIAAIIALAHQIKLARKKSVRNGCLVYLVGLSISLVCSLICDLMLPMMGNCSLLWLGPVSVGATMLGYYYAILRYRMLILSTGWMRVLTYVILMASGAVIYMVIFYLVFTAMFGGLRPSAEVVLLNFVMVLIVLLLIPVLNEVNAFVRSLISTRDVDMGYIAKKLSRLAADRVNLRELAGFLAEHLHFEYVGILVDGKLYGSKALNLSADELKSMAVLPATKEGVWEELGGMKKFCAEKEIVAVAELKDGKGVRFGQVLVGQPMDRGKMEQRNLAEIEMVIRLVAATIDPRNRRRVR